MCKLPNGWIKHEGEIMLYKEGNTVYGENKKACNLVTTKPNNMFRPVHDRHDISGFTAHYVGKDIKDCAVVRLGAPHKGGIDLDRNGNDYHHWKNRTRVIANNYDFDIVGDAKYLLSRSINSPYPYSDTFIKDYGVHGVWVDFGNDEESLTSFFHFTNISGYWKNINTGLK